MREHKQIFLVGALILEEGARIEKSLRCHVDSAARVILHHRVGIEEEEAHRGGVKKHPPPDRPVGGIEETPPIYVEVAFLCDRRKRGTGAVLERNEDGEVPALVQTLG